LAAEPCEKFIILKNHVKYLLKTCVKFTIGKVNLEVILGFQNCVFGKDGEGYCKTRGN